MGMSLESVAVAHAERFPVLPLMPNGKAPATRRGLRSATRESDRIRSWWQQVPGANVGVRTGSGILGIDLDTKSGISGFLELAAYMHHCGGAGIEWLDTYSVATPSGGSHLYYRTEVEVPCRVSVLPGVDVRGEDGYLVAAYSRIGGRCYLPDSGFREEVSVETDGTTTLDRLLPDLAPAPEPLLELVTRKTEIRSVFPEVPRDSIPANDDGDRIRDLPSYVEAVLLGERERLLSARPGSRNSTLNYSAYRLGRHVGAGRIGFDEAERWLIGTAHHMERDESGERDDLTDAEIRATVLSGLRGGVRDE